MTEYELITGIKTDIETMLGIKQVVIVSDETSLDKIININSCAVKSDGIRGEQRGSAYNDYLGVSIYIKTVRVNDGLATKEAAFDLLNKLYALVKNKYRPTSYQCVYHSSTEAEIIRKISFEKLTRI